MALGRKVAQRVTFNSTGTSAGLSPNAFFGEGMGSATVYHTVEGSTKDLTFRLDGSAGDSGVWSPLTAATVASTAGAAKNSTATLTFDKVRVVVTANATTSSTDNEPEAFATFWILARP